MLERTHLFTKPNTLHIDILQLQSTQDQTATLTNSTSSFLTSPDSS